MHGSAIFKTNHGRREVLNGVLLWIPLSPHANDIAPSRNKSICAARDRHRLWMSHKPECHVGDVNADIDERTTAIFFLVDKHAPGGNTTAAHRFGARMINVAHHALVDGTLEGLGTWRKAHVVADLQLVTGFLRCTDHLMALGCVHRHWLFTKDMLASTERIDCDLLVPTVGRTNRDCINLRHREELVVIL